MTGDSTPNDPAHLDAKPNRPARLTMLRWWVVAGGGIAILAALSWRIWQERTLSDQPMLPGQPPSPALVQREGEIRQRAEAILSSQPRLDETPVHPITMVASNAQPDLSSFRIAEDHRTYDLRAWKPVGPQDGPHTSGVVMTRRMKLTKLAPADRIDFLTRTSGADLVVHLDQPRPDAAKVFASQAKPVRSGKAMVEQRLSADVSHVPVGGEFELAYRTTYWNSLQTPEEQWFGTIGYDGSTFLSMLILFPESRPFKGGGLRTGPADGELVPYDGTQMVFKGAGGTWMYWEVPGPKTGHIYRVDWKW